MHGDTRGSSHVDADFRGIVHPDAVFDDLSFEASVAEFFGHIIGRRFVLGRTRNVRSLSQDSQMFLG